MLKNNHAKKLIIFGVLTEMIYLLFYFVEPLRKRFGDQALSLSNSYLFLIVIGLLLLALTLYILAFKQVVKNNIGFKEIFIFFIIFNLTLLFIWPVGSIDIFSYIGWSRVLSEHHTNPYLTAYRAFTNDAFYQQINNKWLSLPTPYGPLFTIIGSALTSIGGNSLLRSLFLFKLFFIMINALNCLLIHKTFKNNGATFLYAWNPLILYEFSINGHSDILTIFFLLLGLYFLLRKQQKLINFILCWTFLMLSVLIKYMTAILLPVVFLSILFKLKRKKEKILFVLLSFAVSTIILCVFYWPFLKTENIFSVLAIYMSHPDMMRCFPPILTAILMFLFYHLKIINYYYWSFAAGKIIFLFFYVSLLTRLFIKRKQLNRQNVIKYSCLALFVFLFTFLPWVMSWYYTILLVLLIYYSVINKFKYNKFIYGITLLGILYYIIQR